MDSMSKQSPPDGFEDYSGTDAPTAELEAGDTLMGVVLETDEGSSEHGQWHRLKLKDEERGVVSYFAKGDVKTALANDDIEQLDEVWIHVEEEPSVYTNDDGEEIEFHAHRLAIKDDG